MNSVSSPRREVSGESSASNALAKGMGWFGLALGTAQLVAPRGVARLIGVKPGTGTSIVMRLLGAREIATSLHALLQPKRPLPMQMRVAGDFLDLALLGVGAATRRASAVRLLGGAAAVAGATVVDALAAKRASREYEAANRPVMYAVTINKPREEVYRFYRNFSQLPMFMDYLESVREITERRSRWVAKLPVGNKTISWDAEIVEDIPGQVIAWQTVEGAPFQMQGRVEFAQTPGRDMTEVRVAMVLGFTGTGASAMLAKAFAKPQVKGDLRRFKQVMETGEVLQSDASSHRMPHPAKPSEDIDKRPQIFIPNPPTAETGVTP